MLGVLGRVGEIGQRALGGNLGVDMYLYDLPL